MRGAALVTRCEDGALVWCALSDDLAAAPPEEQVAVLEDARRWVDLLHAQAARRLLAKHAPVPVDQPSEAGEHGAAATDTETYIVPSERVADLPTVETPVRACRTCGRWGYRLTPSAGWCPAWEHFMDGDMYCTGWRPVSAAPEPAGETQRPVEGMPALEASAYLRSLADWHRRS